MSGLSLSSYNTVHDVPYVRMPYVRTPYVIVAGLSLLSYDTVHDVLYAIRHSVILFYRVTWGVPSLLQVTNVWPFCRAVFILLLLLLLVVLLYLPMVLLLDQGVQIPGA